LNRRGYIDLQDQPRELAGLSAVYSLAELDLVDGLPLREALVIHQLKALFGGEVYEQADAASTPSSAPFEGLHIPLSTKKGPAPAPYRRKGEPLTGQTTIAV